MSLTPRPRDGLGQALVCIVAAVALIAAGCGNNRPDPPTSAVTPDPYTPAVEGVTAAEPAEPEDGSETTETPDEPEDGSETVTEPAEPEDAVATGCVQDGGRVEPYAGCVPEVHPDTPELSWVLDPSRTTRPPTPEGLPDFSPVGAGTGDLPRPTPELVAWSDDVCLGSGTPATVCAQVLNQSVWALDYLGASQACVIAEMTAQVELRHALGGSSMINNLERGWFLCPSVIMPDADTLNPDPECDVVGGGVCFTAEEMAQRCRDVLPADADLYFSDCDGWGAWMVQGSRATLDFAAESLAAEWLQHHYGAPFGWSPG